MRFGRREFLFLGAGGVFAGRHLFGAGAAAGEPVVRFGMVTDLHYADIDPDPAPVNVVGRRFYRESLRKLGEAVELFNARKVDFAIELGDFKDLTQGRERTLQHLDAIEAGFAKFRGPRYHVAGNHDFDCLENAEFFDRIPNDGKVCRRGYYAFARGGVTFIVLNACFDSKMRPYSRNNPWDDANVPPEELAWLEKELAAAPGNVIVFCHQRLEESAEPRHIVRNAAAVRALFEKSGKVKGVITGHQHKGGANVVNGIPYYSLRALVCDSGAGANSFAEVAVYADGAFTVTGWRNAVSRGVQGEFPQCGAVGVGTGAKNAQMVLLEAGPSLAKDLDVFPKKGVYLVVRCASAAAAHETAVLLRRSARLAQGVLLFASRDELAAFKKDCVWTKTALAIGTSADDLWKELRAASEIGVEFLQLDAGTACTAEQFRFLHDLGIRTLCLGGSSVPHDFRRTAARG